ncbi:molybdate ABC transporter substrate-binding protein [Mucilaginibacter galii]|uniref:Molybdate ABC transporter substrate-binding protein n=1 Tax=Mucilaginibacter galii TaxID=2005073 RepID=A0A917N2I9_9SPHI|nr:molybdate ABC transporter substrate-binding protein [Mucilaginibacter galii]GGI51981.1 molybdate ABC transporter substrate-binding protein [Mucilaginibacter galii]
MKRLLILLVVLVLPFAGIAQKLRIAVAANAQFVAKVLADEFKKQNGIEAELIVSSSGKLTTQIEQGAPFDVFLSADMKYPEELYSKKLSTDKPKVYAYGTLVMWAQKGIKLTGGVKALTSPAIRKIAIANAALAPYGEAAEQAMERSNLLSALKPKLVYGESIAQVNQYLLTGAADVAFTAKSIVLDPAQKSNQNWVEVNSKLYQPIAQGVVLLKSSSGASLVQAKNFYAFLFSTRAKQIFKAYGYR